MRYPQNNQWVQLNQGNIVGSLNETHNCNLDGAGTIKLSNKCAVIASDVTADGGDVDFEQVFSIDMFNGDIFVTTDDHVFDGDLDGPFLTDSGSNALSTTASAVVCYDKLYVVDGTEIDSTSNGSSWSSGVITGLNSGAVGGVAHPLCVFDSLPTYKLAVGDVNTVRTYNSSNSANPTVLTLPNQYIVTSLAYRSGYLYVGTKTDEGDQARVFIWDGNTANANYSVPVGASWVFALVPYKSTVAGITNSGELFAVSGSDKVTLGGLPLYYSENRRWFQTVASPASVVQHKGMAVIGERIFFSIEGDIANSLFLPGMKDGLWCYDPQVGVYHYASPTTDPIVVDGGLSLASNQLTTAATHNLVTGDAVEFSSVSGLSGVSTNTVYYAIVTGTTTLKLAGNRYDADQGNAITITGTPGASDKLVYAQNADKGCLLDGSNGAVASPNHRVNVIPTLTTDIVYGAEPYNTSDTRESTLQTFVDAYNVGWFSTQRIYASPNENAFNAVSLFVNGAMLSNEKVVLKYMIEDRPAMPTKDISITWSDSTTFATTDPNARNNLQKGDEVVFLRGSGQGQTAHITNVDVSVNTTTVTVDESIGTAAATGKVYFTGFKKLGTGTSSRLDNGKIRFGLNHPAPWIQLKVEMRGFNIEIVGFELEVGAHK